MLIFSISDKKRNKILYNLRKRSHPAVLLVIIYKLLLVATCFLLFGYGSVFDVAIWSVFSVVWSLPLLPLSFNTSCHVFMLSSPKKSSIIGMV